MNYIIRRFYVCGKAPSLTEQSAGVTQGAGFDYAKWLRKAPNCYAGNLVYGCAKRRF